MSLANARGVTCFAVRRGEVRERLDPKFVVHGGHQTLAGVALRALGDLVVREPDYGSGQRAVARRSDDDVKYIRITDFDDDGISADNEFVTVSNVQARYRLEHNDVLFARSGATAGKTFIYSAELGPAVFAGYCIRFRFDERKALPMFVYLYTKTSRYRAWVRSMQRPSGQPNINKEEFKGFTIPLPDLEVQKTLVEEMERARRRRSRQLGQATGLLANLDSHLLESIGLAKPSSGWRGAYAVRLSRVKNAKQIGAGYFHPERASALSSLQEVAKSMRVSRLAEVADIRREIVKEYEPSIFIGLGDVQSHTGELAAFPVDPGSGQACAFRRGDILFARLRPYLNKVWHAERDGVCSMEFHVIRVMKEVSYLLPEYLSAVLRSSLTVGQTKHMMTGNTHPRLAEADVVDLQVPIPDVRTQRVIVEELRMRREEVRRLQRRASADWEAAKARFEKQTREGHIAK